MDCFRCSICSIEWPYLTIYRECPQCRTANSRKTDADPNKLLTESDARSLAKYYNFLYYLETEHTESDDLDPELEKRLEKHIQDVHQAIEENRLVDELSDESFIAVVKDQFDEEQSARMMEIERIMRGRDYYETRQSELEAEGLI